METESHSGDLKILSKGQLRSIDGYGRLQGFKLELWDDLKTFTNNIESRRSIDITRETKLKQKNETELSICNMEEGVMEEYIFKTNTPSESVKWYGAIKKQIKEHQQWGHITTLTTPMQLAIPGNTKQYYTRQSRQGSLYDQVPILGELPLFKFFLEG